MRTPFATSEVNSRAAIMPSGHHFDLGVEPDLKNIFLGDIAMSLSTARAAAGRMGLFYSVAQRAALLADAVGANEPLAGVHALLHFAPLAFGNWPDTKFVNAAGTGTSEAFARIWARFARGVHEAFDLDWPVPETTAKAIAIALERLHHAELRTVMCGAEREIREYELRGVRPLVARIAPLAADKAFQKFYDTFWAYAARANLRRTAAWRARP